MDEIELRANFQKKLEEGIYGSAPRPMSEYLDEARAEIESSDKAIADFLGSVVPVDELGDKVNKK